MVATAFDYVRADSYESAVRLLGEHGEDAKILAGGQSLGPMLNLRLARPDLLVDISGIPAPEPYVADGALRLSALTRHRTLGEHPLVAAHAPLLAAAAAHVGNVRVRNRGTLGGSLAHCDPAAELAAAALALDARIGVLGPAGPRVIGAREAFVGYLTTALEPAEVITEIAVPLARPGQGWSFQEITRRTSDFAIVAVAATLNPSPNESGVTLARLALAGVADTVVLAADTVFSELSPELSELGTGRALTADGPDRGTWPDRGDIADRIGAAVAASLRPRDDAHATGAYRRRMAAVLSARALREAHQRADGQPAEGETG